MVPRLLVPATCELPLVPSLRRSARPQGQLPRAQAPSCSPAAPCRLPAPPGLQGPHFWLPALTQGSSQHEEGEGWEQHGRTGVLWGPELLGAACCQVPLRWPDWPRLDPGDTACQPHPQPRLVPSLQGGSGCLPQAQGPTLEGQGRPRAPSRGDGEEAGHPAPTPGTQAPLSSSSELLCPQWHEGPAPASGPHWCARGGGGLARMALGRGPSLTQPPAEV